MESLEFKQFRNIAHDWNHFHEFAFVIDKGEFGAKFELERDTAVIVIRPKTLTSKKEAPFLVQYGSVTDKKVINLISQDQFGLVRFYTDKNAKWLSYLGKPILILFFKFDPVKDESKIRYVANRFRKLVWDDYFFERYEDRIFHFAIASSDEYRDFLVSKNL
jgi:hypothetical protein